MRFPLLRTLSARIIVGFAVLILTFGAVSILTVSAMSRLAREIRVIRTGYLNLALTAKDLFEKQKDLRQYLFDDLASEATARRAKEMVRRHRKLRDKLLDDADGHLDALEATDLPPAHAKKVKQIRAGVAMLRRDMAALDPFYTDMLRAPPLARTPIDQATPSRDVSERAKMALKQLQHGEGRLYGLTYRFANDQALLVEHIAARLERNEQRLRLYTGYLGVTALIIGLLITTWATLTLRPLKRLGEGARRVARGDYASRIEEKGPAEVAQLAREFNVMGQAVEERERELVRSERLVAVGKMASMITHEVRNPLSSIGLNTELLEEELTGLGGAEADEARLLCRTINAEVDRLTAITEEYLQFARLPKPKLAAESLDRIVSSLVEFEREQLSTRGVILELTIEPDLPNVLVDEGQVRQCLLNLVRNAADAAEAVGGGTVEICAGRAEEAGFAEVRVRDFGTGIPEDQLPKVFDPFFSTKVGGTGLGLALTHQIIQEHGGQIVVDSVFGEGSTFRVSLPLVPKRGMDGGN